MFKLLKLLSCSILGVGVLISGAVAENGSNPFPGQQNRILHSVSASDISSLMSEFGATTTISRLSPEDSPMMEFKFNDNVRFWGGLGSCTDDINAVGCKIVYIFTTMPRSGLSFQDLNAFTQNYPFVTGYYDEEEGLIIYSRSFFFNGGVGRENIQFNLAAYFTSLSDYFTKQSGKMKSVSFQLPVERNDFTALGKDKLARFSQTELPEVPKGPLRKMLSSRRNTIVAATIDHRWSMKIPELNEVAVD